MACVALTSLMATTELEFMIPNHRVCVDDEKPLCSLFHNLSSLQDFLQKEYNDGGAPIRDVEIKIRDFALKAEDVIEIQLKNILLAKHGDYQEKARVELHQTLREVAKDAEELLNIINEVEVANDSFPLIRWSEPASHTDNILSGGSSQCTPELEDIIMVGNHDFYWLRDRILLNDNYAEERVISIFGVPGLGKTTLCKRLCADEGVVSFFDIQAWVAIPRQHNVHQVLCGLLQSMRPTVVNEIDMGSTIFQLKHQLYNHLKCKRYLIVLDDVCNTLFWDEIQQCFPDDSNGSRILLTTRFYDCIRSYHYQMLLYLTQENNMT